MFNRFDEHHVLWKHSALRTLLVSQERPQDRTCWFTWFTKVWRATTSGRPPANEPAGSMEEGRWKQKSLPVTVQRVIVDDGQRLGAQRRAAESCSCGAHARRIGGGSRGRTGPGLVSEAERLERVWGLASIFFSFFFVVLVVCFWDMLGCLLGSFLEPKSYQNATVSLVLFVMCPCVVQSFQCFRGCYVHLSFFFSSFFEWFLVILWIYFGIMLGFFWVPELVILGVDFCMIFPFVPRVAKSGPRAAHSAPRVAESRTRAAQERPRAV